MCKIQCNPLSVNIWLLRVLYFSMVIMPLLGSTSVPTILRGWLMCVTLNHCSEGPTRHVFILSDTVHLHGYHLAFLTFLVTEQVPADSYVLTGMDQSQSVRKEQEVFFQFNVQDELLEVVWLWTKIVTLVHCFAAAIKLFNFVFGCDLHILFGKVNNYAIRPYF